MWRGPRRITRALHGPRNWKVTTFAAVVLIFTISILVLCRNKGKPNPNLYLPKLKRNSLTTVQLHPSMEFMNGTDVIWQVPDSPNAVLFLAHGCNGRAANFWDRSPGCPNCIGLPEERLIVLRALDRKFAVLTISSLGRCWSFGREITNIKWIIRWWVEKNKLEKLPMMSLGASSGGYFVSALAMEMKFSSIAIMIAEGVFKGMDAPNSYPPTLFVHMPKDHSRMMLIKRHMEALRKKGVHVGEVRCMEFPLTPNLLSDRIPGLEWTLSVKIFELFREKGFIDEKGFMREDGRATLWKKALKEKGYSLEKFEWADHIQEELNLAFGYHEMTSLQTDYILDWYESHKS